MDAHANDPRFVAYYEAASATERAHARAASIMATVLRVRRERGFETAALAVADIGCNAGTQSRCWLEAGHRVSGIDISRDLVELARERNEPYAARADFQVGSAARLPWSDHSFDVCLLPELLEHVDDWASCLSEAARVLRPRGSLYLSTTNVLCPVQQEFSLPLYSWYPGWVKKRFVQRAMTDSPQLANFASYPAVHWFSPYRLKRFLENLSVEALDRFDVVDLGAQSQLGRLALYCIRGVRLLRLIGHVLTPSTVLIGFKDASAQFNN